MLEAVGFAWCSTIEAEKNGQWDQMFERLLAFHAAEGHPNVPANWSKDKQLARWVARQKEIRDTIPINRKEKLESIGFLWSLRDINWDKMFERLQAFFDENEHAMVPHVHEGDTRLSEWVYRQRQYPNRLSDVQKEKLNSVNFMWRENMQKLPDRNWKKMYNKLKVFKNKHGHCKVPSKSKEDPQLSSWVSRQRHSKNKLEKWKIEKLNEISFSWAEDIRKEKRKAWLNMYTRLKKFNTDNGHCNVPSQYDADEKLGRWIETQRLYKDKMEQWKIDMLERLGFKWSEDIQREKKLRWYKMYDKLKAFHTRFGHSRVPEYWAEDQELSLWVIGQRRPKKPL
ncbi:MAG: helicase associated domain-containing protein, partial [Myxococcota bacterium]